MARTYKRDNNGRFASTGTTRSGPKARMATRGTNRLTRDNSGRITSVGGQGATARGGRLRTASGAKRGAVVARMSLQRGGVVGKPKGLKPGALKGRGVSGEKSYGRGVDTAKVERILGRLQKGGSNYEAKTKRLKFAKEAAGRETRRRASDFLSKQSGLQKSGTSMGRTQWKAPEGLTRGQMMQNIASRLPKQTRRSTAKTGNKKIVTRADARQQRIADRLNPPRVSYVFGRNEPKPAAPKRLSQRYSGATGRGLKSLTVAASRQRSRRRTVETLAGTGRLMATSARLSRGRAKQTSLLGGRSTTYGPVRRR
jgi:hypothetical protein